jgi:signal transduction histidine kinase
LVSQLEQAAFPLVRERIDLTQLVQSSVDRVRSEADRKDVTLMQSTELGSTAHADPSLLQRVLSNLLDNSLRFTPTGGRISVAASGARGLDLSVSNSGPPIPPAERTRIFEKFVRGDGSQRHLNTGLGLYFCRCAVEAHGGRIAVEDHADFSTCFRIQVPAA